MLYELVKREKVNEFYDPFIGDDKFYYNLALLIDKYSKYNNVDYALTGTIAFAIFFEKTYRTTKDLDMHVNPEDIQKWVSFFKKILFKDFEVIYHDQNYKPQNRNVSIKGKDEQGVDRSIELFGVASVKGLRQSEYGVTICRGLNLSIKNNCRIKTIYLRPKDFDDIHYYNLNLFYYFYHNFYKSIFPWLSLIRTLPLKLTILIIKNEKTKI